MKEGKTEGKMRGGGRRGWRKTSEQRLMSRTKKVTLQRRTDKREEYERPTGPGRLNQTHKC